MQVTSDCLFHFTLSLDSLQGILKDKFRISYCYEKYVLDYQAHESYYPMVSFCDIPLSLAKDQIERYGCYAIGLSKSWAIKNNLNPVVYIEKESLLAKDIQATIDNTIELLDIMSDHISQIGSSTKAVVNTLANKIKDLKPGTPSQTLLTNTEEAVKAISEISRSLDNCSQLNHKLRDNTHASLNLFRYMKNYHGELKRKQKTVATYRFYDEREWRYVPSNREDLKGELSSDEYKKFKGDSESKPFITNLKLSFTSEDIKYLIVESNNDIPKLIRIIHNTDYLVSNRDQADILTTKILTVEQLKNDF